MLRLIVVLLACGLMTGSAVGETGYRLPPPEVVEIIDAPPEPLVRFSPDGKWMLLAELRAMPPIEDLARRMLRLGGIRIDPAARSAFQIGFGRALQLRRTDDPDSAVRIPLPEEARISLISWSQSSERFVFGLVTERGTELWGATVAEPEKPVRLTDRLTTVLSGVDWMPDGKRIVCRLVPRDWPEEPAPPRKPLGPNVEETSGNTSPSRTYQDLLTNPHDEALFEHYATGQLAILDFDGSTQEIGAPAMFDAAEVSPDGNYLLVTLIQRPFSYLLPYRSFPKQIAVWDLNGRVVRVIADVPMEENIPIEGVRTGPRRVVWTSSDPARLMWFEALDGGDPRVKAPARDRLMTQEAPFSESPRELTQIEHRAWSVSFFADPNLAAVTEYDRDRRWMRTLLHDWSKPDAPPKVWVDRNVRDQYGDPGDLVSRRNAQGHAIARQDGNWVYLSGSGATPEGYRPFLDRRNLETLETERLWRCEAGELEGLVMIVNSSADTRPTIITNRETPTTPPNYLVRNLQDDTVVALTDFPDPTPQIRGIKKQLITYKRADGVPLSATLYLPADYEPGTRLPLFIWAYPIEFTDPTTAGQVTASPNQFTRMRGATHLVLATQGYAVLDNATMPVVGDPETMNDTFVEQIVASAQAAIDKAVEMGVADPNRVAVGGHSYGAFMTANLLAHSDLFRAGIARSGAYNRTLTPFGFQSERRPLWEAPSIYFKLSPFMHAHQIREPLLLIHGESDNNAGTFPLQSQRMFQAIKGNGGTARLVMLPHESHGYAARESVLHTLAEMIDWLNRYVRDADISSSAEPSASTPTNANP